MKAVFTLQYLQYYSIYSIYFSNRIIVKLLYIAGAQAKTIRFWGDLAGKIEIPSGKKISHTLGIVNLFHLRILNISNIINLGK